MIIPGIVGRGDTKLICGIRIAGMNLRTRKADKVILSVDYQSYAFFSSLNFHGHFLYNNTLFFHLLLYIGWSLLCEPLMDMQFILVRTSVHAHTCSYSIFLWFCFFFFFTIFILIVNDVIWYLGAYDDEVAAAHSYDLAALKYWGHETILNFPVATTEIIIYMLFCSWGISSSSTLLFKLLRITDCITTFWYGCM